MSAVMNSARRSITSPSLPIGEEGRPADPGTRWRSRPVSRILYPGRRRTGGPGGGHLSWSRVAATLVQPTREHRAGHPLPARPCSGWGLPSRPVTRPLVSSYLTVSPLPLFGPSVPSTVRPVGGLSLWHFPRVTPPGRCPAPCPVESGLSSANPSPRPPGRLLRHQV